MAVKEHRRFDGHGHGIDEAVLLAAIQTQAQTQDGADSDDDDDAPPEAIGTSAAKEAEQSMQREKRIQAETARAAKRKVNREKGEKRAAAAAAAAAASSNAAHVKSRPDATGGNLSKNKGKARAATRQDPDIPAEDAEAVAAPSSAASTRLDPSLFLQASTALNEAKARAKQEQKQKQRLEWERQSAASTSASTSASSSSRLLPPKRSHDAGALAGANKKKRVIGDVTVQQIDSLLHDDKSAPVDSSTALPSRKNDKFVDDRLFKKKKSVFGRTSANSKGKGKVKDESKPFLLFDPLLDKAPAAESKNKAKNKSRAASRMELEEKLRGRTSAQMAFTKATRVKGPALAFASASSGRSGRKARSSLQDQHRGR